MQDHTKQHLLKIIDLLYNECKRSGGDGDAIWFIKYYKLAFEFLNIYTKMPDTKEFEDFCNQYDVTDIDYN